MDHTRLRLGEFVAAGGALATFVLLFFHWRSTSGEAIYVLRGYGAVEDGGPSGWDSLGWFMVVLVVLAILGGVAVAAAVASRRPAALPIGAAVLTFTGASLVTLILLVRVAFLDDQTAIAWIGVLTTALIPFGALLSMRDERTAAPSSQRPLVPSRPAPPA